MHKTRIALLLGLFCSVATCTDFKWHPVLNVSKGEPLGTPTHQSLPDGSIHIFWGRTVNGTNSLVYQVFLPNATLVTKASVESLFKHHRFHSVSAHVSDDGKHVLVAYVGSIRLPGCDDNLHFPCEKVYFIESLDGGKTWSDPLALDRGERDYAVHSQPSILLDKGTGRVFISYTAGIKAASSRVYTPRVAVREPGKELFTSVRLSTKIYSSVRTLLGLTVDRTSSKRYLHVVAETRTSGYYGLETLYTRSKDNGKTWSDFSKIDEYKYMGECYPNTLVTNTQVDEAGVYLRYSTEIAGQLFKKSKDHGERFGRSSTVSNRCHPNAKMLLCGRDNRGIILFAHFDLNSQKPYASYSSINSRQFVELPYAFEKLPYEKYEYYGVSCSPIMNSRYLINLLVRPIGENLLFAARGILNLD